ncbi:ABC transporter ATP-binding protein (plasmid) [Paenibacillus rhizovicinus]|uniref:ABC transporter ATP-binding protein n=1 Tax=Paenibacillus rhizovicinus TaxID=2704463 RepID=A0A6C0PCV4_9BACL|nr:ABC transporter ATP-binding protein [Paenibacillus rhizovicinus]QHW35412.1 ABC transporter ATP-binding protein [Paenibacillus rhizovicinus]
MDNALLEMRMVSKTIGKKPIIDGLNLRVDRGSILALCGDNGAGKSTILRMIAGILQQSSGDITVNGLSWKRDRYRYAEVIGYMPDNYRFGGGLSAEEHLAFWSKLRKAPKERVPELLELVGLSDVRRKPVSAFSKGMRQRLLFAQALLARPALLVLDEPTNGLDPFWMETFINLVQTVKNEGQSVLFSTHQLDVAESCADRLVFLSGGKIVQEGRSASLRNLYGRKDGASHDGTTP